MAIEVFSGIDDQWFRENGLNIDPIKAFSDWEAWLVQRKRSDEAMYRKVLVLASGKSDAAIRHYFRRPHKLSAETRGYLDGITIALGRKPRHDKGFVEHSRTRPLKNRIALLTEITGIPSTPYHFQVIAGIVNAAAEHGFCVAIHEVFRSEFPRLIQRVSRTYQPDGIVMLRLTPDSDAIQTITNVNIPTVLIHADRYQFPVPIIANIIPRQEPIKEYIRTWAFNLANWRKIQKQSDTQLRDKIVLVHVAAEDRKITLPPTHAIPEIRKHRIELIWSALDGLARVKVSVSDYSFRQAFSVWDQHKNALGYICLSDELAVGIKHLLQATNSSNNWKQRILGFDNSPTAQAETITSFGHDVKGVGRQAVETLIRYVEHRDIDENESEFRQIETDIHLVLR